MKRLFSILVAVIVVIAFCVPAFAATSVTLTEHNIFFFVNNGQIGFQETVSYNNPNGEAIKVVLPKEATEISSASAAGTVVLKNTDLKAVDGGLEATIQVPKGNDLIELRYNVKPVNSGFDYITKINYVTEKTQLLSTGDIIPFGHQLGQLPKEKAPNGFYMVPVNPLKVGELLQVRLAADPNALSGKKPEATSQPEPVQQGSAAKPVRSSASGALIYILIFILIILVAVAGYYFIRMRKQS